MCIQCLLEMLHEERRHPLKELLATLLQIAHLTNSFCGSFVSIEQRNVLSSVITENLQLLLHNKKMLWYKTRYVSVAARAKNWVILLGPFHIAIKHVLSKCNNQLERSVVSWRMLIRVCLATLQLDEFGGDGVNVALCLVCILDVLSKIK